MSQITETPSYQSQRNEMVKHIAGVMPVNIKVTMDDNADQLADQYTQPIKLKVGNTAPLFELPNASGNIVKLTGLLEAGPVVLLFYRGTWCPYCNLWLKTYQNILPQIKEKGANLVAISGQTPDQSLSLKEKNELEFEVLSDAHFETSRKYTTVFKNSDEPIAAMKQLGVDFYSFYSDDSADLLVPVVYIIDKKGTVIFAGSKGGDYRERVEPAEILAALNK